ncbi:hypothetical protein INS49_008059 [Diaporthe citri]|uniref:uncharacterized protein n=1 Tax=Diaporthe citri TaxID=83186 RepID=UPI001C82062A|nr:uncharacterized protein INS49_008059 [Diaporthe citri]KAG6362964.1 hypothetical protein INS49_008059 [Diaporthe citri]
MPLYEVLHSIPLNEAEKSEVARAITAIHTRRFTVPSLFVNVRLTDVREHHMYVGGEKVLSRFTSRSSTTPTPPPDGGFSAWMCVLGTHLVVMNTWGVINSFGVFQSYYVDALHRSPSDISWIGPVEIFLLFFIGTVTGRLTDAGFFRPLFLTGGVLVVGGALAASASGRYWQIFLAQGVCVGLGNGCLFCPAVAVVSTYFQRRRSLALGLGACGSSTGGVLFPIMVRQLLPRIGFEWTIRTIALAQCVLLACFWGTYFAFFYISTYSRDIQGM